MNSTLRLTTRGRIVFTALAAVPIVAGVGMLALNGGGAVASSTASGAHFQQVTVHAGQSLWGIATQVAPAADPRDVVDEIVALNQLPSVLVTPGQQLAIPAHYSSAGH